MELDEVFHGHQPETEHDEVCRNFMRKEHEVGGINDGQQGRQRVHAEVEGQLCERRGQHSHHGAGRQDEVEQGADQQQDIEEGCRAHTRQHFGQMPGDKLGEAQFGSDNAYAQTGGDKEDDAQVDFFDAGG